MSKIDNLTKTKTKHKTYPLFSVQIRLIVKDPTVGVKCITAIIVQLYKTEKMIAVRNQRIAEFQLHWSTFEKLFEDC